MLLERCVPGDWRDQRHFVFVARPDESRADVLRLLFEKFVPALFPHAPHLLPRNRWTGIDITFRDVGLPMNIHGLFIDTYMGYLNVEYGGETLDGKPVGVPALPLALVDEQHDDHQEGVAEAEQAPDGADGQVPEAAPAAQAKKPDHPCKVFADQSKAFRGQARDWLVTEPSIKLLFFRSVLNPIKRFLEMELEMASE
eukprot:5909694-Pyramimonas_sp.AAC.1